MQPLRSSSPSPHPSSIIVKSRHRNQGRIELVPKLETPARTSRTANSADRLGVMPTTTDDDSSLARVVVAVSLLGALLRTTDLVACNVQALAKVGVVMIAPRVLGPLSGAASSKSHRPLARDVLRSVMIALRRIGALRRAADAVADWVWAHVFRVVFVGPGSGPAPDQYNVYMISWQRIRPGSQVVIVVAHNLTDDEGRCEIGGLEEMAIPHDAAA